MFSLSFSSFCFSFSHSSLSFFSFFSLQPTHFLSNPKQSNPQHDRWRAAVGDRLLSIWPWSPPLDTVYPWIHPYTAIGRPPTRPCNMVLGTTRTPHQDHPRTPATSDSRAHSCVGQSLLSIPLSPQEDTCRIRTMRDHLARTGWATGPWSERLGTRLLPPWPIWL